MNAFTRRGACPALSAPMQTGDGLLVRLNPVAGGLSPKALASLCKAARAHGNGVVEVTARGSLQIRGLTVASAPVFAAEVDALGIAVRTGVPVETGRLAGLDPAEIADPAELAELAEEIRAAIGAAGLEARLGPKVSVVVDGGGRSGMDEVAADVRLTAARRQGGVFWGLSIAGDAETATPLAILGQRAACDAAIAVLAAIASLGREARARDLEAEETLHSFAPRSVLPDISLARGEMSGRTERGVTGEKTSPLCSFPLTDSRFAVGIALPFGHTDAETLIEFARKADSFGIAEIRPAPRRAMLLLCPSELAANAIQAEAVELGFVTDDSDPRTRIAACPGSPACASGRIAARDIAAEIALSAGGLLDPSVSLHISGCAKGCAHPGAASLTLTGSENGAGIVVGGTAKDLPSAYTPADGLVPAFGRVSGLIRAERRDRENLAECLSRVGRGKIAEAFERQ